MAETLTRAQMRAIIERRESVMIGGNIISRVEDLPSEVELSVGDPERQDAERARLQAEIERLSDQVEELQAAKAAEKPSAQAESKQPPEGSAEKPKEPNPPEQQPAKGKK